MGLVTTNFDNFGLSRGRSMETVDFHLLGSQKVCSMGWAGLLNNIGPLGIKFITNSNLLEDQWASKDNQPGLGTE